MIFICRAPLISAVTHSHVASMCRKSVDISPPRADPRNNSTTSRWTWISADSQPSGFWQPSDIQTALFMWSACVRRVIFAHRTAARQRRVCVLLTYRWAFALVCFSASLRAEQSWTILSSPRACTFVFVRDGSVRLFRGRSHGTRYCARQQRYATQWKNNAGKVELLLIWRHSKLSVQLRKTQRELCARPVWRPVRISAPRARDTSTFLSSDV